MKLSTKKLFTLKKSPIKKSRNIHTSQLISLSNKKKDPSQKSNSNFKKKLLFNTISENHNPFTKPKICSNIVKKKKLLNMLSPQTKKINVVFSKPNNFFEDSYINNLLLTSESDSKKVKPKINKNKNINNQNKETICNLFKKTNLKSTIIIDNKGNNNLNLEQKKMISNYFNKKNKNFVIKIKSIKTQKYNVKNNVIKQKSSLNKKLFNLKMKKINKLEEKTEKDNNSIFENYTNNSIDSSFLGSSINDYFYQDLDDKNN